MPLERVALLGASSRVGPAILEAISSADSPATSITVFLRPTSKPLPSYPKTQTKTLPSSTPTVADLTAALKGQDALICAIHPSILDIQLRLADACVAAGVKRYILADYGSAESDDPVAGSLLSLFQNKTAVRVYCKKLAFENAGFSWSSLVTGHFFDYGLSTELLGFDLRKREVLLFDGGTDKWSASTVAQIGKGVAGILKNEAKTAGKVLYMQSFSVTQLEVLDAVEAVIGKGSLQKHEVESNNYIQQVKKKIDDGDKEALEELVGVLGVKRSYWEGKDGYSNNLLGLQEESLQDVVEKVCREVISS